jgi:hypothetical protein
LIDQKRLMGFARLFRPTLAGANMGHPSRARRPVVLIPALIGRRLVISSAAGLKFLYTVSIPRERHHTFVLGCQPEEK